MTELATQYPPAGLVLRSPFVDLAAVAAEHYPFLPVRALLCDRYPLAEQIAGVDVPASMCRRRWCWAPPIPSCRPSRVGPWRRPPGTCIG